VHDLCIAATGQLRSGVEPGVMQTTRNKNNFIYPGLQTATKWSHFATKN